MPRRFTAMGALALLVSCGTEPQARLEPAPETPVFREAAAEVGLHFKHFNGATGEYFLPEIMGAGVAVCDYDGDGDLDVYALQGASLDPDGVQPDATIGAGRVLPPGNAVFRNELIPSGQLQFTEVTEQAAIGHMEYGMGAAVGDIDNDGDLDLYVTNFGPNVLYRNNGDGTFTNVTAEAGADDDRWSTSATFFDYDRDGYLDLFVAHYVDFTLRGNIPCFDPTGAPDYCNPVVYQPLPDRLFRNEGGGTFADVTTQAGLGAAFGSGLGVVASDFNADDWPDLFVANDGNANQLWMNQRDGTFRDEALLAGVAYNADGVSEAGMGITAADFDIDADLDVFVTHLVDETNTLYVNDGRARFTDETSRFNLSHPRAPGTGFGTRWFDYDSDGWLDLFVANGAVRVVDALRASDRPYHQRNQLFRNEGGGKFRDVTDKAGEALQPLEVGRGAAFGDVDNDGDIDIVVSNNNGPLRLLLNEARSGNHWVHLQLKATQGDLHAFGARVTLYPENGKPLVRYVHTDGSYLSAHDSRIHLGLGVEAAVPQRVTVDWPNRNAEQWTDIRLDESAILLEGAGTREDR